MEVAGIGAHLFMSVAKEACCSQLVMQAHPDLAVARRMMMGVSGRRALMFISICWKPATRASSSALFFTNTLYFLAMGLLPL